MILRATVRWSLVTALTAAPGAWLFLSRGGVEPSEKWGVAVGVVLWALLLVRHECRSARAGRAAPNRALLLGAKIQLVAIPVVAFATDGFGLMLLYFPALLALAVVSWLSLPIAEWLGVPSSAVTFVGVALMTTLCGAVHLLVAFVLGALFGPIEPSRRRRARTPPTAPAAARREECREESRG